MSDIEAYIKLLSEIIDELEEIKVRMAACYADIGGLNKQLGDRQIELSQHYKRQIELMRKQNELTNAYPGRYASEEQGKEDTSHQI